MLAVHRAVTSLRDVDLNVDVKESSCIDLEIIPQSAQKPIRCHSVRHTDFRFLFWEGVRAIYSSRG